MNPVLAIASVVMKELYRRKDFYVLFVLTALLTALLGWVTFFNDPKIVRHLKEVCLLLVWVSALVIAIGMAARQIPAERENRTIFPLLAKPVTRGQVIVGKFLGCWLACGIALIVFYLFFAIITESRGHDHAPSLKQSAPTATSTTPANVGEPGHDAEHSDHDDDENAMRHSPAVNYFQALWLHWMMLGVVTAMVLFGSVVFTAPSSNATICLIVVVGILLLGEHLNKVALQQPPPLQTIIYLIYFALPHLELFDIRDRVIYDQPPVEWAYCGLDTLYAGAYAVLFLFLAWLVFRRRTLAG